MRCLLPLDFSSAGAVIDRAGKDKEQVGKTIGICEDDRGHGAGTERHNRALRTATNGSCQMQQRAGGVATRKNEAPERRQCRFGLVNRALESRHILRRYGSLAHATRDLVRGIGQHRAQGKQVSLDRIQKQVELRADALRPSQTEQGIELVHVTVGGDTRVGLGDARPVEQRRLAFVSGPCIDAHGGGPANLTPVRRKKPHTLPVPSHRRWFRRRLLDWYRRNGRDLPWRQTRDPYRVLVSEIMLQQTQVDRVLPKYAEWLERYPSFERLAAADIREVVQTWYPLGYNIRPRRLHAIARESVERFAGSLPDDEHTLRSFKGIGAYTAGAVMSFAFGKRAAILDTNVARVLYRVFVGRGDFKSHAMKNRLWEVSRSVLPHRHVYDFNQALMDLGATVCSARRPRCGECPMTRNCRSYPLPRS